MFVPPTMLPTDLRMSLDPPPRFQQASDNPPELVPSTSWSQLRSILSWSRRLRKPTDMPCGDAADLSMTLAQGRPSPCTD
jgi:hypothetical protein